MTAEARNRAGLLALLLVALAATLAWQFWPWAGTSPRAATGGTRAQAPNGRAPDQRAAPGAVDPDALLVKLDALHAAVADPEPTGRDPFRFRPQPPPPPPPPPPVAKPGPGTSVPGGEGVPGEPAPPPPPPPIALKFIGFVNRGTQGKVAVLSDGKFVYHGREGDIIEGRYRVVRVGDESVQMEYLDGRGRQSIRLSGS